MSDYGICEKCGEIVELHHTPAYPITGWEIARTGGGANHIKRRERIPNRVRHSTCLPRLNDNQDQLFAEPAA